MQVVEGLQCSKYCSQCRGYRSKQNSQMSLPYSFMELTFSWKCIDNKQTKVNLHFFTAMQQIKIKINLRKRNVVWWQILQRKIKQAGRW